MAAVVRGAVVRPGPDPTYADGDDAAWMDVDWPALQRTLDLDGQRVNVLDTGGAGPVLLFLHGWSSNWQIFLLNIAAFMDTHRVVSLDLPGFGASALPEEPISIRGLRAAGRRDVLRAGDRARLGRRQLDGRLHRRRARAVVPPPRVDRLVLVSAAGLSTEELPELPLLAAARVLAAGLPAASRFESSVRAPPAPAPGGDAVV